MQLLQEDNRGLIMLTLLMPEQVSSLWNIIKYAIEESLPPVVDESPDKMNNILTALLCGKAQCWASYVKLKEGNKFEGIVITKISHDDVSSTKSLLIYCMYGYEGSSKATWTKGLKALVKFAISRGCTSIVGYTETSSIINLVERLGGETKYRFIRIPLFN